MTRKLAIFIFAIYSTLNIGLIVQLVKNPYEYVDWDKFNQYKANFHTHTTCSGGSQSPDSVIITYSKSNYSILSITDHNYVFWPWNILPKTSNMLSIRGIEFSNSFHVNGLFNFTLTSANHEQGIIDVESNHGRSILNHPGRYHKKYEWAWFIPWYSNYSTCIGVEVFNQGDRYPNDRHLWDNINEHLFPITGKFVWGFSNDDMHTPDHLFRNFQFMLMPSLSEKNLVYSMDRGMFYFCYEPSGSGNADVPRISKIVVDNTSKTITLTATSFNKISWYGPGTKLYCTGNVFNYSKYTNKPFIRAVLDGLNGYSFTQPFGFETKIIK